MAVAAVNLTIQKGTDFENSFILSTDDGSALNLIGKSAVAKLKKHPTATTSYSFQTTITVADSSVRLTMPKSTTATLPSGRCVYDVLLVDSVNNVTTKAITGTIIVEDSVSV